MCLVDGMPTNCGAASNFVSSGAGVPGPLNRTRFDHRRGMFVHFTAIANATGWIPIGARYLAGLSWGWTDYSKWAAPSHTFTFTENRLSDLRYYAGSLEFHYGNGIQRDVYGRILAETGVELNPDADPIWIVAGGLAGGLRNSARSSAGAATTRITIRSAKIMSNFGVV